MAFVQQFPVPSRRRVLAAGCLALSGGAGCSRVRDAVAGDDTGDDTTGASDGSATTEEAPTGTDDGAAGTTTTDASEFRIAVTDDSGGEVELVTGADVKSVGEVRESRQGDGYHVPMTLTDEGAEEFAAGLESVGALDDPDGHEIRTYFDGELIYSARLGERLAAEIEGGWSGEFLFRTSDRETARRVRDALEDG